MLKNLREPITSAIGFTIMIVTLLGVYRGQIAWQWDAVIGLCVGSIFFMIPDKLGSLILDILKKVTDKYLGNNEQGKNC